MRFQALCFLAIFSSATSLVSPNWKRCPDGPGFEECLQRAIQEAEKDIHGGRIGFQVFDSISYDTISVIDQANGPFRGKLLFNNATIEGLLNNDVKKVKRLGNNILRITFFIPKAIVRGNYIMDTALLSIPIKGDGIFTLDCYNYTISFDFTIRKIKIDGRNVYNVENVKKHSFQVDYLQFHLSNLFNGNKALSDNVNKILNEQWKLLAKDLAPLVIDSFSPLYMKASNSVLNKISADEFPLSLA